MRRLGVWTVAATLGAVVVTGCGSTENPSPIDTFTLPTDTPTAPITPLDPVPIDFRSVTGPGFTLAVPSAWEATQPTSSSGEPSYFFEDSTQPAGKPVAALVVKQAPSDSGAFEQSTLLVTSLRDFGATEINRSEIDWPKAEHAVLVDWNETPGGASEPQHRRQLFLEDSAGGLISVVVAAPKDTYGSTPLDDVLASLAFS